MPRYNADDNTYERHPDCPINEDDQTDCQCPELDRAEAEHLAEATAETFADLHDGAARLTSGVHSNRITMLGDDDTLRPIDPTGYRFFTIKGTLHTASGPYEIFWPVHANDLPAGEDGKDVLLERVRTALATQLDDPAATWQEVEVEEFEPPSQMFEGPIPF